MDEHYVTDEIFASELVKFDVVGVGTSTRRFSLHKDLVTNVSNLLSDEVANNHWTGGVRLHGISHEAFQKFVGWLYTKEYSTVPPSVEDDIVYAEASCGPEPVLARGDSPVAAESVFVTPGQESHTELEVCLPIRVATPKMYNDLVGETQPSKGKSKSRKKQKPVKKLQTQGGNVESPGSPPVVDEGAHDFSGAISVGRFRIVQVEHFDMGPGYSYLDSFLIHAKMYVFAERYAIGELLSLAVQKLERALNGFGHYRERAKDIVALARYVYESTTRTHQGQPHTLRGAVAAGLARNFEQLIKTAKFTELWVEGGDLVEDVGDRVGERLSELEARPRFPK